MRNAVIVTEVVDVYDTGCDHGCTQVVRLTNLLDDAVWEMCVVSFEALIGRSLRIMDCKARGHGKCVGCPYS